MNSAARRRAQRGRAITLGCWPLPSGNALTVIVERARRRTRAVTVSLDWDEPMPPRAQRRADFSSLLTCIPAIVRALCEWAERPVPAEIAIDPPGAVTIVYGARGPVIEAADDVVLPRSLQWTPHMRPMW